MPRLFTVEQANRALPLVRRIVEDIVSHFHRWEERVRELEIAGANEPPDRPEAQAEALRREIAVLAEDITRFERELSELGVRAPQGIYRHGLVDFPGEVEGRQVYLCWRLGEPVVMYWHDVDAGFAGRRPLPETALA